MIVTYLGKNISEYRKNILHILCSSILCCPVCNHEMRYHSKYNRHIHIDKIVEWIPIYRLECTNCHTTHAAIPDFISPRKHFSACDIELALRDVVEDNIPAEEVETAASISTVKRWVAEFKEKVHQAGGALKSLLFMHFNKTIGEITLFGLSSFKLLERILKEFPIIENSDLVISQANIWLFRNMMGGVHIVCFPHSLKNDRRGPPVN